MNNTLMPEPACKVIICDDDPLARASEAAMVELDPRYKVCAECDTAAQAIAAVRQHQPDLVIVDLPPGRSALKSFCAGLRRESSRARILILSKHDETEFAFQSLKAGANGYLMKNASTETLRKAIGTVMAGKLFVSDPIFKGLLQTLVQDKRAGF